MSWPGEIGGHLVDRETDPEHDGHEAFHAIECGRTVEDRPDEPALEARNGPV